MSSSEGQGTVPNGSEDLIDERASWQHSKRRTDMQCLHSHAQKALATVIMIMSSVFSESQDPVVPAWRSLQYGQRCKTLRCCQQGATLCVYGRHEHVLVNKRTDRSKVFLHACSVTQHASHVLRDFENVARTSSEQRLLRSDNDERSETQKCA